MPADDLAKLDELAATLNEAEHWSPLHRELQRIRGRNTGYGSPVNRGEAIRWAVRFALDHYPVDAAVVPPDRHDQLD